MSKTLNFILAILTLALIATGIATAFYTPLKPYFTNYISGLGQFTGTLLGVVTGIIITYIVQSIAIKQNRKQMVANFVFELEHNQEKIEEWTTELTNFRNAVNGDALANYFGYFKFSTFVGVIAGNLHTSGEAYTVLTKEQFRQLLETYGLFTLATEKFLNDDITKYRETFITLRDAGNLTQWTNVEKPKLIAMIGFWDQKMITHKNTLRSVIEGLRDY